MVRQQRKGREIYAVLSQLIEIFGKMLKKIIITIDDLQWLDSETFNFFLECNTIYQFFETLLILLNVISLQ